MTGTGGVTGTGGAPSGSGGMTVAAGGGVESGGAGGRGSDGAGQGGRSSTGTSTAVGAPGPGCSCEIGRSSHMNPGWLAFALGLLGLTCFARVRRLERRTDRDGTEIP